MSASAGYPSLIAGFDTSSPGRVLASDGPEYQWDFSLAKGWVDVNGNGWTVAVAGTPPNVQPAGTGSGNAVRAHAFMQLKRNLTDTLAGTQFIFQGWDISYLRATGSDLVEVRLKSWSGGTAAAMSTLDTIDATELSTTGSWQEYTADLGSPQLLTPGTIYTVEVYIEAAASVGNAAIGRLRPSIRRFRLD